MATLASLLTDLYDITKRPDLVAESKLAIKMATQKLHHSDFYPRDLTEEAIAFTTPAYLQSIEYKTVFPTFRALSYLRKLDSVGTPGKEFTTITPLQVLDSYKRERVDVCYLAGIMLEIKSSTQDAGVIVGYYQHPDTTETGYSSWIADEYPVYILMEAAATIFKMIGFDEQAAMFNRLTEQNVAELRSNALQLQGY